MSRLLALYPRRWRDRYGEEFLALLADRPPAFRERLDIVCGAIDAHVDPQLAGPKRAPDRAGFIPLAGFALFVLGLLVAASGPLRYDDYGSYRDGAAALPFIVVAMVLLAVGIHRLVRRLPAGATAARAAGLTAIAAGLLWSTMPWLMPIALVFLCAVAVLAAGLYRSRTWPTWLAVALGALVAVPFALIVVQLFQPWYANRGESIALVVVVSSVAGLWLVLGLGLLRGYATLPAD